MEILGQPVSRMHIWALILLPAVAVLSSYTLGVFPLPLIIAAVFAALLDIAIREYCLRQKPKLPLSSLITGLIIGSVAPINAPIQMVLVAVAAAIVSKFAIRYRSSNVFNPAAFGLAIGLVVFGLGDEWWAASSYGVYGLAIPIAVVLVVLAYEARRLTTAASFIAASLAFAVAFGGLSSLSLASAVALVFGVNYYFAFVMLVEPRTSPYGVRTQAAYGVALAAIYLGFAYLKIPHTPLLALLAGNVIYLVYRAYIR